MLLDQRHRIRQRCLVGQPVGLCWRRNQVRWRLANWWVRWLVIRTASVVVRLPASPAALRSRWSAAGADQRRSAGSGAGSPPQPIAVKLLGALLDALAQVGGVRPSSNTRQGGGAAVAWRLISCPEA